MNFHRGETVELTRKHLYEKVWAKSAVQLAKELGISDVAIAKMCKKHHVPKPPLGYWARVEHGQKIRRPALPKLDDDKLEVVRFQRWQSPEDKLLLPQNAAAMIEAEKEAGRQIVVAKQLVEPHPLVEKTLKSMMSAAADERGIVRPRAKQCLNVAVSQANIDRAMRIMDALVKALDARGFPVSVGDGENSGGTFAKVMDEPLAIGLLEKTDCKKRPPTAEQLARQAKYSWDRPPTIYDYTPSGKLKLSIYTGGYDSLRRNWTDLVHRRVEACLNTFIAALIKVAEREKADRIKAEEEKRAWEEEKRQREEEARRVEEEKAKREDLDARASSWRKSRELREYISTVEEAANRRFGKIDPESELGKWLAWAKHRAEKVDPIAKVLDRLTQKHADQEDENDRDDDFDDDDD